MNQKQAPNSNNNIYIINIYLDKLVYLYWIKFCNHINLDKKNKSKNRTRTIRTVQS